MFDADDPKTVRTEVRRRLTDEHLRVVMAALDLGAPAKLTKSGIVFAGTDGEGTANTHWTISDWRASKNLEAQLRRIGYDMPRVIKGNGNRANGRKKSPKGPERFVPLKASYEVPRPQTVTHRFTIEPDPEPELQPAEERRLRREPGARARALSMRKIDPRLARLYPRLSDDLRAVEPDLVVAALKVADGEPRRVTVQPDGSLMVWNRPAW